MSAALISALSGTGKMCPARDRMLLIIALILVLAWIGGFVVFHVAGFLIHLLLIFAVISIIFHFLRGLSTAA
jgi:Family of unknown function (DUF5670)